MANRSGSRCRIADCASSTNLAETLKVPGASGRGVAVGGANNSGVWPGAVHVTSDGLTSFSTSARAALRQPSKSVSPSSVMKCILVLLYTYNTHRRHPEEPRIARRLEGCAAASAILRGSQGLAPQDDGLF